MKTFSKLFFALIISFTAILSAKAAEPLRVQNFEGGIGLLRNSISLGAPSGLEAGGTALPLLLASAEVRLNLPNTPWDIGVCYSYIDAAYIDDDCPGFHGNESFMFGVCSHYNLRQGRKVNPYFGLGAGVALWDPFDGKAGFAIEPRVGVEFLYHIRLSLECQISRKYYNAVGLTLGFVIGGRPKKPKKTE